MLAGAVFSLCATRDCVIDAGASVEGGPSSSSVDVKVFVRYKAVCKASAGETQLADALQLQTPRPGKKLSIELLVAPHSSDTVTNVQPLGSSIVLTPRVCMPSGRSGCDGKTAAAPVGAIEHVGVPPTVVERVPVHVMFGG